MEGLDFRVGTWLTWLSKNPVSCGGETAASAKLDVLYCSSPVVLYIPGTFRCQPQTLTSGEPAPQDTKSSNHTIKLLLKRKINFLQSGMKLYLFFLFAAHIVKNWARSVLDKQEPQTGFLLRGDGSSEYNNFTSKPPCACFCPWMTTHLQCNAYAARCPGVSPRVKFWHILTFPPLRARAKLPAGGRRRQNAGGKRGGGHLNPPAFTGKQQLSALLLTLSHSSRTSPQFCGSAAQPRDPRDLMLGAEAFSRGKSISGDCRCCRFFFLRC